MYQKEKKQIYNDYIVYMIKVVKKSYTWIMLIIFISFMLLCHVHIQTNTSGLSFVNAFKLRF